MTYLHLAYFHLATVLPAYLIATFLLFNRKGTRLHKTLGRVFILLMLITAAASLLMPAEAARLPGINHFGWIHLLSLITFAALLHAWRAARRGNIREHRFTMIILYVSGMLAGTFAVISPERLIYTFLFG